MKKYLLTASLIALHFAAFTQNADGDPGNDPDAIPLDNKFIYAVIAVVILYALYKLFKLKKKL